MFIVTKWDREIEQKVKKDKDITALTDMRHIKAQFLCLLATHRRKKGTKEMNSGKKERENDKPAYLLLFHRLKSLVITFCCLLFYPPLLLFHFFLFFFCIHTCMLSDFHSPHFISQLALPLINTCTLSWLFCIFLSASFEPPFPAVMLLTTRIAPVITVNDILCCVC